MGSVHRIPKINYEPLKWHRYTFQTFTSSLMSQKYASTFYIRCTKVFVALLKTFKTT